MFILRQQRGNFFFAFRCCDSNIRLSQMDCWWNKTFFCAEHFEVATSRWSTAFNWRSVHFTICVKYWLVRTCFSIFLNKWALVDFRYYFAVVKASQNCNTTFVRFRRVSPTHPPTFSRGMTPNHNFRLLFMSI